MPAHDALDAAAATTVASDVATRALSAGVRLSRIRIVLCQTSHPGNIGAAARALKTMGLSQLFLVAPQRFPHADATARASGATDVLDAARVCATLDEALAGCALAIGLSARHRELVGAVWPAREAALEAVRHASAGNVALVFGTEMSGLTNDEVSRCQALAYIPSNPEYGSLNLAAAVQVLSYEVRMAAGLVGGYAAVTYRPADQEEIAGLHGHAARTMRDLGFFNPERPRRLLPRLRRLFARTRLEHDEVNILRGILAAVDRGLKRGPVTSEPPSISVPFPEGEGSQAAPFSPGEVGNQSAPFSLGEKGRG